MIIRIIFCFFLVSNVFAKSIVCPSVEEIKKNLFHSWLPLYIDTEEQASLDEILQFINGVQAFVVAKWNKSYLENGHCFYSGHAITNKIILAHDAFKPEENSNWHWVSSGILAECYAASPTHCAFLE